MKVERERGISVTASVMTFDYAERTFNLLDTPGHEDFSEDTYRVLTAVDSAVMVIDATTGQAHVLAAAFNFNAGGGGSGGGCHAVPIQGPPDGRALPGMAGLLLVMLAVWSFSVLQRKRATARIPR